jgi:hypothetical protein
MCVYTQESISQKLEKGRERKKRKKADVIGEVLLLLCV